MVSFYGLFCQFISRFISLFVEGIVDCLRPNIQACWPYWGRVMVVVEIHFRSVEGIEVSWCPCGHVACTRLLPSYYRYQLVCFIHFPEFLRFCCLLKGLSSFNRRLYTCYRCFRVVYPFYLYQASCTWSPYFYHFLRLKVRRVWLYARSVWLDNPYHCI